MLNITWLVTVALGFGAAGCDSAGVEKDDDAASTSVVFDMRSEAAKNGSAECRSVAETVYLTVPTGTDFVEADPFRELVVFEDVTVPWGIVTFESEVYSNVDSLLFRGETNAEISGERFADVAIQLLRLDGVPVMEICLATDELVFSVQNRGRGILDWWIEPLDSKDCVDQGGNETDCVLFNQESGALNPDEATNVEVTLLAPSEPVPYEIRIGSYWGFVDVDIVVEPVSGTWAH